MTLGKFIVFEGIDGSGTSTQVLELMRKIEDLNKYQDVLRTHEPWKNDEIKKILQNSKNAYSDGEKLAELYVQDRKNHLDELIIPNLKKEVIVLSSRYMMSTLAYQWTQGVNLTKLIQMHEEKIMKPDLTFFLDVPVKVAKQRISSREKLEKFERDEYFKNNLRKKYLELVSLAEKNPNLLGKVTLIDGTQSIKKVSDNIFQEFLRIYNFRL